jgi:3-dehydroquinate dehydratase II
VEMGKSVLVINGPNLNLLGTREPEIYGHLTLSDIQEKCASHAASQGLNMSFMQSNSEGELVDTVQGAKGKHDGIVINAAAYTHTSVAIMDAIKGVGLPTVEVHISNTFSREDFRHHSYISPIALGVICGFGVKSYILALDALVDYFEQRK